MVQKKLLFLLISLLATSSFATLETVKVPGGSLDAVWLSPVATKDKKKALPSTFSVESFAAMTKAVTVAQFGQFLKEKPKWQKSNISPLFSDHHYLKSYSSDRKDTPVTEVSWFAAKAFCEHHEMRLPTLNEWEYMAAASETKKDANKDAKFLKRILDWYGETHRELKPVGSIYKNIYGIWDLHGLIWEWVEDFNSITVTGESRQDGALNKDMFCGSGAIAGANKEDYAAFMRFAFRSSLKGKSSVWNLGFRCVK